MSHSDVNWKAAKCHVSFDPLWGIFEPNVPFLYTYNRCFTSTVVSGGTKCLGGAGQQNTLIVIIIVLFQELIPERLASPNPDEVHKEGLRQH